MILEWTNEYKNLNSSEEEMIIAFNAWLQTDSNYNLNTFRTLVSE